MKTFYTIFANSMIAAFTNNFLWFALSFWTYLETRSIIATAVIGGVYMLLSAVFGLAFGTYVDHHKKKLAMLVSSIGTLILYLAAGLLYAITTPELRTDLGQPYFWLFVFLVLFGAILGNMRMIALSTTVTMLVPSGRRDKANGLVGAGNGIAFTLPSVVSGLAIGQLGMGWTVLIAIIITSLLILHLTTVQVNELAHEDAHDAPKRIDIKGTLKTVNAIPGLLAIIFFATFNNFLGGIYMALMDPYGLEITSVEIYGLMWGLVSVGFIIGGWIVSKKGLGSKPLQVMFLSNIVIWIVCILFPIKSSIILFGIGMLIYMTLIPVVEAAEQTVLQRVVPFKKQGRVFGFAQSLEWAAAPITAFLIGPIAQFWVVPYMTTGSGAQTIGSWFGTGTDRGMALVFMVAGVLGLIVTLVAMASKSYKLLSKYNSQAVPSKAVTEA